MPGNIVEKNNRNDGISLLMDNDKQIEQIVAKG